MKLLTGAEKAVLRKDFGELWNTKMARSMLLMLPIMLAVALPLFYILLIVFIPADQFNGIDNMSALLPPRLASLDDKQTMFYLMSNTICPMLFLMIPLMVSTVSSANSFVGEKERNTMETLLLTPLSIRSIFKAKVLSCTALALLVTAISFVLFSIVMIFGNVMLGMVVFPSWNWAVLILVLTPAVTVFGVIFMVLVSGKSKTFVESYQTGGFLVLPVVLLFVGQFMGLFQLSALVMLIIGVVVALLDVLLFWLASKAFTPEKLLK